MNFLQKSLDELTRLHPKVIDLSLGRLLCLLKKLDNPHKKLPPIIHIAGTNGKGSTQAFLKAILKAHGKSVHAYISPHLVTFNERIELNGQSISDVELAELIDEVKRINAGDAITFFEITTAIAFLAFSRIKANYLILETGLGGRFDATNVVESPIVTAITPISIDHEEFLGSDIRKIAQEKAGIFKPHTPSFWAKQQQSVYETLCKEAFELDTVYQYEGKDWQVIEDFWRKGDYRVSLQNIGLLGQHQQQNAALALSISEHILAAEFKEKIATQALKKAFWPARLQKIEEGVLKQLIPHHALYLDGAHNVHGAINLAYYAENFWKDKPLYLFWGMLNNRDAKQWLAPFKSLFSIVVTLPLQSTPNGYKPSYLQEVAQMQSFEAYACDDMEAGFEFLAQKPQGRVLMAGSLYMLGDFLKFN